MITERIASLLEEKFSEAEFSDCFLIEIRPVNQKLEVFIDSDSGITFDKCQKVSRFLEQHIDEGGWLGDNYILEVSSPGVGRPLILPRQYTRNIGRRMEIHTADGAKHDGTLMAAGETAITIEEKVKRKEGKKTKTELVQTTIPFEAITKAIVKITF